MTKRTDLTGCRFGRLQVISYARTLIGCAYWLCRCDCGAEKIIAGSNLRSGLSRSCGCWWKETAAQRRREARKYDHDEVRTPEYRAWASLRNRCSNRKHAGYPYYGGRGITVCERWASYENFLADMGRRPSPQHSIDRFPDNDGPYSPDNCRWATAKEQAANRRPQSRKTESSYAAA